MIHKAPAADHRTVREITNPTAQHFPQRDFSVVFLLPFRLGIGNPLADDFRECETVPADTFRGFTNDS
ncbi:MAG: hypothetical protein ABIT37_21630 [Luteolibacter sp.]